MIYAKMPPGFKPKFHVASCFVECNRAILLLHRQDNKPQGNTWGVPAGKVEAGEKPAETIIRETDEEAGIAINPADLHYFGKIYVRYPRLDFIFYIYRAILTQPPTVKINPTEHKGFKWALPKDALTMPLIQDEDACIKMFYNL